MFLSIRKIHNWPWSKIGNVFTVLGVIFSIGFSLVTFNWGLSQYNETTRPYLEPEHMFLDKEYKDQNILLVLPLRNYGKSPAFFEAEYSGYGKKKTFQGGNTIFPEQTLEISWQTSLKELSGVPCYILRDGNERITISYGVGKNNLEHKLILERKEIPIPQGSTLFGDRKVSSAQCEEGQHAFPWHVVNRD